MKHTMKPRSHRSGLILFLYLLFLSVQPSIGAERLDEYDVVIYGGTSGGIAAAVQVSRMGGRVLVIEPSKRIGGLTTGGLGHTDIGNKAAIGGISREFYQRIRKHYSQPSAWKYQKSQEYQARGHNQAGKKEDTMWTFEPSVALKIMNDFVRENRIEVWYSERLDRSTPQAGVTKQKNRIRSLRLESGRVVKGKVFIDASYEGDLIAAAGVTFTVGREPNDRYNETLNGVQTAHAIKHQLMPGVDPYIEKGNPKSGLLPGIDPNGPGKEGQGDHRVQAYCFRMCLTDVPGNRIPFRKPDGYNELEYELLFRNFEAGAKVIPWSHSLMPNRKSDTNNNRGFSTDYIGRNYDYPNASYREREEIVRRHRVYQQGLMWTLAYHPRTPEFVRNVISKWGTCKDEFESADGWQEQLYIREARRMVGETVMTQHHCQGRVTASRPVGLAAYTMDSHNVQRHIDKQGFVRNEGDVQVGGFSPYPIDYGAVVPRKKECTNLLVPVSLSASHIAFGSIRMEPVFMVLGQSAGTAAMHSIAENVPVQDIDFPRLRKRLEADKQRLVWTGPKRTTPIGLKSVQLKGLVIDDVAARKTGFQTESTSVGPYIDRGYIHDGNDGKGQQSVEFAVKIKEPGRYDVRLAYAAHTNRATNVPVTIYHQGGSTRIRVNQRKKPADSPFQSVGVFEFGDKARIVIGNEATDGYVIVDAIQLLPVSPK